VTLRSASYIGIEFAQMFRRFGAEVTVVEKSVRLVSHEDEDEDVSAEIRAFLEAEGIAVRTDGRQGSMASFRPRYRSKRICVYFFGIFWRQAA
jgi:pyruvate/2-oxoglutarate dehydrogenase complex dihydrolipoamide dehydrogenase (E3) component